MRIRRKQAYTAGPTPWLAYWGRPRPKAGVDVWLAIAITLILATYRLGTEVAFPFADYFRAYTDFPIATALMNGLFFWLLPLLWIAYRRWQTAEGTRQELERVASSITPDVLIVVNEQRVIELCAGATQPMFGYTGADIVGKTTDLLYANGQYGRQNGQLYQILNDVGFHIGQATGLHRDGRKFPVELITGRMQDSSDGVVILLRDITARVEAEEAFHASNLRFEQFMYHLPACACIKDADGRFVYLNKGFADTFEVAATAVLGKTEHDVFPDPFATTSRTADVHVLATKQTLQRTEQIPKQETLRCMLTYRFPILQSGCEPLVGFIAVDITEKQQAEEERLKLETQMQRTQKIESLGILGGGIAHDFNNLLMGILGNADLALTELPDDPAGARRYIEEVIAITRRAADVTNQILAYSGKGKFAIRTMDLNELITDMTHLLQISIKKKARLSFELDNRIPPIDCDETQVRQVMMNLVINASDALGDKDGAITVTTGVGAHDTNAPDALFPANQITAGPHVFVRVTDEGCGMDQATLNLIFDPFFSTKFTGRGLGLASVLGIVRGHQGAIAVKSKEGSGSTFTVYFPISAKAVERRTVPMHADDTWKGSGTVLVVDDEESVRDVAEHMLQLIGFKTCPLTNGRAAVTWFRKHAAEVTAVLMDTTMPVMDGIEAAREIRKLSPTVPIILTSGYVRHEQFPDATPANPTEYFLNKPFRLDTIRACMRKALDPDVA